MHRSFVTTLLVAGFTATTLLGAVHCGDDDDGATVTVSGRMTELTADPVQVLSGAEICVLNRSGIPCVQTDAQGNFSIELPADKELLLSASSDGYQDMLVHFVTTDMDYTVPGDLGLLTQVEADVAWAALGATPDATKGHLMVRAFDAAAWTDATGVPAITYSLSPTHGGVEAYFDDTMTPDNALTATVSNGIGGFANATPGEYLLTASHASLTCSAVYAFPSSTANTFRVTVEAGILTWVFIYCE